MKVIVTGITGALGRLVTEQLVAHKHDVMGIDRRPWPDPPDGVEIVQSDIRKRPAEDVFRKWRPDALIHMATVTHASHNMGTTSERYRINLDGTRALFDACHAFGVRRAIFVGRHTVYGAASDSPLYHTEDDPPLAVSTFPDLADLVAADLYAASAIWRFPELRTSVLRLVYTLGPSRRGTLASYLSGEKVPSAVGFDPLFHFMHERDAAMAIALALDADLRGVYNVAGPSPVPLSLLCRLTGHARVPLPGPVFEQLVGRFGFSSLPRAAIGHVKYPIVVDARAFLKATGFKWKFDEIQTMESYRWA